MFKRRQTTKSLAAMLPTIWKPPIQRGILSVQSTWRQLATKKRRALLVYLRTIVSTDARRESGRPCIRPPGHRCHPVRDGDSQSRARFSSDAANAAWRLSIRAICSDCCCAGRYLRFPWEAADMHCQRALTWRQAMACEFADAPPPHDEFLQLLAIERR